MGVAHVKPEKCSFMHMWEHCKKKKKETHIMYNVGMIVLAERVASWSVASWNLKELNRIIFKYIDNYVPSGQLWIYFFQNHPVDFNFLDINWSLLVIYSVTSSFNTSTTCPALTNIKGKLDILCYSKICI